MERQKEITIKVTLSQLESALRKYNSAIGDVEQRIATFVEFDFSIFYQPSDGFVLVDEHANTAPLEECLRILKEEGNLTHEEYLRYRI